MEIGPWQRGILKKGSFLQVPGITENSVKKADNLLVLERKPASIKLVACPCCSTRESKKRPEDWYFDNDLVRQSVAGRYDPEPAGTAVWQCVLCKNRRKVTPAKAMTFILTHL